MSRSIRIGAELVPPGTSIAAPRAFWRMADESSFDHLLVYDHLARTATPRSPRPTRSTGGHY